MGSTIVLELKTCLTIGVHFKTLTNLLKMRNVLRFAVVFQLAFVLSACTPMFKQAAIDPYAVEHEARQQREAVLNLAMKRLARLEGLSYPLRRAAVALCDEHEKGLGLEVHDESEYLKEYGAVAEALYHFGKTVKVYYVHPDSPATEAGIRDGDSIVAIEGQVLQQAKDWKKRLNEVSDKKDTVVLTINNSMGQRDILVPFVPVVSYDSVLLLYEERVKGYADGNNIYISSGMLRLMESDEELAFLIGHELAHNCLIHISKKKWGWFLWPSGYLFVYGWKGAEIEADRLGVYIMARAGYDITKSEQFLRHMATTFPRNIKPGFFARHPPAPGRVLALKTTIAEIQRKVVTGEPLVP